MAFMVRDFIERNWESLRSELATRQHRGSDTQALATVDRLLAEWSEIPLEEKQIPYQSGEREFWFALYTLETVLKPEKMLNAQGEAISLDHPVWRVFARDVSIAEAAMDGGSLPERCNAFRPLP